VAPSGGAGFYFSLHLRRLVSVYKLTNLLIPNWSNARQEADGLNVSQHDETLLAAA
jgi:hypothetical protein